MPHDDRPLHHGQKWHDQKAPDGFTVNGWRKICKGGYVRMSAGKHYHEKFADWVGRWVFVEIDDPYGINVIVWPDEPWHDSRTILRCTNGHDWLDEPKQTG